MSCKEMYRDLRKTFRNIFWKMSPALNVAQLSPTKSRTHLISGKRLLRKTEIIF